MKATNSISRPKVIKVFISFMVALTALLIISDIVFLAPKVDQFSKLRAETEVITARISSQKLQQYLHDRELALKDIASHPLIINSTMQDESNNPAFLDYMKSITLLGENPQLTIIDALGNLFFTEQNTPENHRWALPLLQPSNSNSLIHIPHNDIEQIQLAVPIQLNNHPEGLLIATLNAAPSALYGSQNNLSEQYGVIISKNGNQISSPVEHIKEQHRETVLIEPYDLEFTYISDYSPVLKEQKIFIFRLILNEVLSLIFIIAILWFLGKTLIIRPYQKLANSEKMISSAIEGIVQTDINNQYTSINQSFADILGTSIPELFQKNFSDLLLPDDKPAFEKALLSLQEKEKTELEVRCYQEDKSIVYLRLIIVAQKDKNDSLEGYNYFVQNITKRKHNEQKIAAQQKDFQLIFNHIPFMVWFKDDQNNIIRLNQLAAISMGGRVEDFEGKNTYDLFPFMAKKYHDDDLKVINSGKPIENMVEEYTPLNGPSCWVSTTKIPYTDTNTNKSFLFVCAQDISSLKRTEQEKNKLIKELSDSNEELENFTRIASHDLKSPIRGVEQLASWLHDDCAHLLPDDSKKHLKLMQNRVHRMIQLLDDLLDYSHASTLVQEPEPINLEAVLNKIIDLRITPFNFSTRLELPKNLEIEIPRKPFEIILRNLLDNAVKHHHKKTGTITISYEQNAKTHFISVSDDGPGIPPDLHEEAFKVFQTLQPRDKIEGSGVGLAIIRKILLRYGGSISIDSDGISGTTFKIVWHKTPPN